MKIVQIAAGLAALNTSRPIGSQASGDTGRSRLMSGAAMRRRNAKRPIMKPSGMPTSAARPKPMPTRCSDEQHVPADALVVRALAVERVAEHLDRGVAGLRAAPGMPCSCCATQRPDARRAARRRATGGSTLQPAAARSRRGALGAGVGAARRGGSRPPRGRDGCAMRPARRSPRLVARHRRRRRGRRLAHGGCVITSGRHVDLERRRRTSSGPCRPTPRRRSACAVRIGSFGTLRLRRARRPACRCRSG